MSISFQINGGTPLTTLFPAGSSGDDFFVPFASFANSGDAAVATSVAVVFSSTKLAWGAQIDSIEAGSPVDSDGDGWADGDDNCPLIANPQQHDSDGDDVGTVCDNCRVLPNPLQEDVNEDGCGDVCETAGCAGVVCANP